MKNISKNEIKQEIEDFFKKINKKSPKEIKKIKRLAMKNNIPLKEKRKLFCKKCYSPYLNSKIIIRNGKKIIICNSCNNVSGWKL